MKFVWIECFTLWKLQLLCAQKHIANLGKVATKVSFNGEVSAIVNPHLSPHPLKTEAAHY